MRVERLRRMACVVLGSALLMSCATPHEPTPASSLPVASSTATPLATADPPSPHESAAATASSTSTAEAGLTWAEQIVAGEFQAVFADGDRFVAVGRADDRQVAWVSMDGTTWERHDVPPPADVEVSDVIGEEYIVRGSGMGTLVRLDDTVYSFGFFNLMDFVRPVGWRWTDGAAWEAITSASPFYEEGSIRDAAAGDGVLVAARLDVALSEFGADSEVWAWSPAASWQQSDLSVAEAERVIVNRLAWNEGVFVATGAVVPEQPEPEANWTPRAWQSTDGRQWHEVAPPSEDAAVCALEADPEGGFVAMGLSAAESIVWRWREGNWSGIPVAAYPVHAGRSGNPFTATCALVPLDNGAVAVLGDAQETRVWRSPDGESWVGGEGFSPAHTSNPPHVAGFGSTVVLAYLESDPTGSSVRTVVRTGTLP